MTGNERMHAVLSGKQPDDAVPIWELGFYCMDAASGRHLVQGREFEALSPAGRERALEENADIVAAVAEKYDFAAVSTLGGYWEIAPGTPAYYWLPADYRLRQASILRKRLGRNRMMVGSCGGVMAIPGAGEYEEFCVTLLEEPERLEERAERTLEQGLEGAKELRDAGCDAVYTASDMADNRGPFFRPEQMRRLILPYLAKWARAVKGMGLHAILHTDGNLHPIMDELCDSGVEAVQAVDPVAGMDIVLAKRQARGRVALAGNIDCGLLVRGPEEKVYAEVRRVLEACKPGGGFILGASNTIYRETPIRHYDAMHRAWKEHGTYARRPS